MKKLLFSIRGSMLRAFMVTVTVIAIPCSLWAQQAQITLTSRELTARELFDIIENQTEHVFTGYTD